MATGQYQHVKNSSCHASRAVAFNSSVDRCINDFSPCILTKRNGLCSNNNRTNHGTDQHTIFNRDDSRTAVSITQPLRRTSFQLRVVDSHEYYKPRRCLKTAPLSSNDCFFALNDVPDIVNEPFVDGLTVVHEENFHLMPHKRQDAHECGPQRARDTRSLFSNTYILGIFNHSRPHVYTDDVNTFITTGRSKSVWFGFKEVLHIPINEGLHGVSWKVRLLSDIQVCLKDAAKHDLPECAAEAS